MKQNGEAGTMSSTLFDKIWQSHVVTVTDEGDTLLYVV
jgi:hypothetical protein